MRTVKSLRIFGLLLALQALTPACVAPLSGPVHHAGNFKAAVVIPPTIPPTGLVVVMDTVVTTTTPAVSQYIFIGKQSTLGMQLVTTGTLAGTWKIEVSCSPTAVVTVNTDPTTSAAAPTFPVVNDDPSDITSAFSPSIGSVSSGGSSQYVQASPLNAGYVRATFTATSGSGNARVNLRN